jgi:hypothetical protein
MTAVAHEAVTPTFGALLRRGRFWIIAAIAVVAIALGSGVLGAVGSAGGTFSPENPGPAGARALRSVLEQQGVRVTTTTTVADSAKLPGTLLVDDTDATIPAGSWAQLLAGRSQVVVVAPEATALAALLPDVSAAGNPDASAAAASCDLPLAQRAGAMSLTDVNLSLRATSSTACFTSPAGGSQLISGTHDGVQVLLLADATAFTNAHIAVSGNAAVALGALGRSRDLVWFTQSSLDPAATAGAKTLQDLTPPWVTPLVALLLLTGLATALWQGRRLGPIVVEALPVIVRSRETVEGRARLYNRGSARLHAADSLRIGAIRRMAPNLGLSRNASVDEVITAATRLTGRSRETVAAILVNLEPGSDADLVRVSDDLAGLEAAVRAAAAPGASFPTTQDARSGEPR